MPDEITYITDDFTRWGEGKGAPINATEHDIGLWSLSERVREVEENPPEPISISNVTVSGSQMTVHLSNGGTLGPFTLPVAVMQAAGNYTPDRAYLTLDLVKVGGFGLYLVLQDHTAPDVFDPDLEISGEPVYFLIMETGVIFGVDIEGDRLLTIDDAFRYFDVLGNSDTPTDGTVIITVPGESSDNPWQAGTSIQFEAQPNVVIEFAGESDVEIRCAAPLKRSRADFSVVALLYKGDNIWTLAGDLQIA